MGSHDRLALARDVPLAPFTTLGVGGAARWFVRAEEIEDIVAAHDWCAERGEPLLVLGGGSNLVVADWGFSGLVLQMGLCGMTITSTPDETRVAAAAGESWDGVVETAVARGLHGVEALSGIPGTVGGTPIQNVGAYGQEVAHVVEHVTVFDRQASVVTDLPREDCRFAYRTSRFKAEDAGRFVICGVTLRLRPGPPDEAYAEVTRELLEGRCLTPTVHDVRTAVLAVRRRKGMVIDAADPDSRSVGSFFMNPVVTPAQHAHVERATGETAPGHATGRAQVKLPAAWLIEHAGFRKGLVDGTVGLSSKHPLAIVNRGGATARDVLRLAARVKRAVADRFGIWLRPEPVFIGLDANEDAEFLQKAQG